MTHKDYTIDIEQSDDLESPLEWATPQERGAWFVMGHNKYTLPNELDVNFDNYNNFTELAEDNLEPGQVYRFVNWYEHGNISLTLIDREVPTDRWDAGIAGVVIGNTKEDIFAAFSEYKAYVEGDIWSYVIKKDGAIIDSLSGIYGHEDAEKEAIAAVDRLAVSAGQTVQ